MEVGFINVVMAPNLYGTLVRRCSLGHGSVEASGLNLFILFSGCHLGWHIIIVVFVAWTFGLVQLFGLVHICCHLGLYNFVGHLGLYIFVATLGHCTAGK